MCTVRGMLEKLEWIEEIRIVGGEMEMAVSVCEKLEGWRGIGGSWSDEEVAIRGKRR